MTVTKGMPTGNIGYGSSLLLADNVILSAAAVCTSDPITRIMVNTVGTDINADHGYTVKIVRLPDGETESGCIRCWHSGGGYTVLFCLYYPPLSCNKNRRREYRRV